MTKLRPKPKYDLRDQVLCCFCSDSKIYYVLNRTYSKHGWRYCLSEDDPLEFKNPNYFVVHESLLTLASEKS